MTKGAAQTLLTDETDLLDRARNKDRAAITQIIRQQNQRLYRIARSIVRDDDEAEDVLQESYIRAFSNLETFRGESQFSTWLTRIIINEALGRLRRRRPTLDPNAIEDNASMAAQVIPFPNASPKLDPETILAQRELSMLLERTIDGLPAEFRTILVARAIEGMSTEETADLFGLLPQTVKTRLHRARQLVKHEMRKHIGPALGNAFPFAGRRCERLARIVLERLHLD
jgi:RNA polymerase sigma-70 factor (ECF subfamily)